MLSFLFLFANSAQAEDSLVVDRPSVGTASSVVSPGTIQIETGLQIDSGATPDCNDCLYSFSAAGYSLPTMLRLGIHERFEIRPYSSVIVYNQELQGFQGSGLQGKVSLYTPEDKPFSLSVLASGDLNAGGGTMLLDFWGSTSGFQWGGWVNIGNTTAYEDGSTSLLLVEGFGIPLPNNQGVFIESTTTLQSGIVSSSVEGGFSKTYSDFQWDVYLLHSLTEDASWQLATGLAWRIR